MHMHNVHVGTLCMYMYMSIVFNAVLIAQYAPFVRSDSVAVQLWSGMEESSSFNAVISYRAKSLQHIISLAEN